MAAALPAVAGRGAAPVFCGRAAGADAPKSVHRNVMLSEVMAAAWQRAGRNLAYAINLWFSF